LLEDYLRRRDEAAVAALIRRHGPMVWGVCRRVLASHHDAEDAFQATFLVLVRKAASIRSREQVGNWLYGVAHQTALKARATAAKRQARERQVAAMPEPAARPEPDLWHDVEPLLDQELSRLPDKYRVAVVLCDLGGKTRKEVSRQLRIPEGTLSSRLTTARAMLTKRLARRGVALPVAALAAVLSPKASSAGVPTWLVSCTIKAATLAAAGQTAATGATSVKVAALAEGVLKNMGWPHLKTLAAVLVVVIGTGACALALHGQTAELHRTDKPEKAPAAAVATAKHDADAVKGPGESGLVRSTVRLSVLGRALHAYHDTHGSLPPAALWSKEGKPLLSWRVAVLPYLPGGKGLYEKFRLDEPWDSPHNRRLLAEMPSIYAAASRGRKKGWTPYQAFVGKGAAFEGRKGLRLPTDFPDGTVNTVLVVEAAEAVPWTKPGDLAYDPDKPLPRLGGRFRNGFLALFADGSVWFIKKDFTEKAMRDAITRNGGEVLNEQELTDTDRPE
jgi:RNA polymerase sigma factor (sigma-70 family)